MSARSATAPPSATHALWFVACVAERKRRPEPLERGVGDGDPDRRRRGFSRRSPPNLPTITPSRLTCDRDRETGLRSRSACAASASAAADAPHDREAYGNAGRAPSDCASGYWWDRGRDAQPPARSWLCGQRRHRFEQGGTRPARTHCARSVPLRPTIGHRLNAEPHGHAAYRIFRIGLSLARTGSWPKAAASR
jgi:hypothetical protein